MKCSDYNLTIYLNGTQIRNDSGCVGDVHTYTTSTTLPSDVIYNWYLDSIVPPSQIVGTNSTYSYTFENKDRVLYLVATSPSIGCAIQVSVDIDSLECKDHCEIECVKQDVNFPAGKLTKLKDRFGNIWNVPGGRSFDCIKPSIKNDTTARLIRLYLNGQPNCNNVDIPVTWKINKTGPYCINLTIENSPIKFATITIDGKEYNFNTNNC